MLAERAASIPAPVHRLLVWYESTRLVRVLVRHLPFGTGSAVDVALVAARALLGESARLKKWGFLAAPRGCGLLCAGATGAFGGKFDARAQRRMCEPRVTNSTFRRAIQTACPTMG